MYNEHPYFPQKNLGKKVRIIHGKIHKLVALISNVFLTFFQEQYHISCSLKIMIISLFLMELVLDNLILSEPGSILRNKQKHNV